MNGTLCPLSKSSAPITAAQPAGCPITGQPVLPDPLAPKLTTSSPLGTPMCTGASVTNTVAYSPAVTLNGGITISATSVPVKWAAGSPNPVAVGDVIVVESEQMRVNAITAVTGTTATLTVTRAYGGTTAAAHASGKAVIKAVTTVLGTAANPSPCVYTSGTVTFNPGTYYGGICVGSASTSGCDSGNCNTTVTTSAYSPALTLSAGITNLATSVPVKWTSGTDPVAVNDVILVESEKMLVTAITPVTRTTATLTVTRAYSSTTAAAHASGKAVTKVNSLP